MTFCPSVRLHRNTSINPILRTGRDYILYHTLPLLQSYVAAVDPRLSWRVEHDSSHNAHQLFDEMPLRGLKEYNQLLFYYSRNDDTREALHLLVRLCRSGLPIEGPILSNVLKVCASSFDDLVGRQVHCQCMKSGFLQDVSVGTALVDMYMKNACVRDGKKVFDEMEEKNVVSWTSLISGYSWNGYNDHVMKLFCQMRVEGYMPNHYTVSTILGALANHDAVEAGIQIHAMVVKHGFETIIPVCNSLINMYSKSGMLREAGAIFYSMESKDSVSWNSMISGQMTNGHDLQALELFYQMQFAGVKPTQMTFVSIIKSCTNLKDLDFVRQLHCRTLKSGYSNDQGILTALMSAYLKCKEMDCAYDLLSLMSGGQNVVTWTAMINGYLQNGNSEHALDLFSQMRRLGVKPNHFTYSTILKVQNAVSIFQIHAEVIKANYKKSSSVGTALLDAYVKRGNIYDAIKVFEVIEAKDIIAWSAMIAGYAQTGETEEAAKVFLQLSREGTKPNEFTFSSIINACASSLASIEQGKQFHACAIKMRLNNALCVSSALVTMYSKRGNIESASEVFKRQEERDLVSWNSMISGYAQHGHAIKALEVFEKMQNQNMEVDAITFIGVISGCTHAGLVDEGQRYFNMMVNDHDIKPTMEHYSCMVDLYSRAGLLDKAMDIINGMPFPPCTTVWRTLLAACRVHRNMELGKLAAEKLILLQPQHSAAYVLLSNMYAAAGKWQERANVRKLMEKRRVKKEAGYSWIEIKYKTYSFLAGDLSHPMSDQIYSKLADLNIRLKDAGYQPDTNFVYHDVEDEHKEAILSQHSERLAVAYGLIATVPEVPIQIVKNLRVCGDCHNFIKLISLVEQRYIVVRDSNRFHHFKGGLCSCGDYW
ncbi:hypothetical protein QN277_001060 [Acacia crassicarpa]|uniref:DYW domain-containing protein n=1 Tax=Acacia crassicarpa TaxID=499986 RepID=A0AAE1THW9_9FABA|nr:hypothetical protein QN277_001060 [Acacia crassicarpa]